MSAYHIRVWETGGLITLAKISLAEGDKVEAEKLLTEAMSIATEHSLTIRQKEINSLHDQI